MNSNQYRKAKGAEYFALGAAFTTSATYIAGKSSIFLASSIAKVDPSLPVEVMAYAGAPLAALLSHSYVAQKVRTSDITPTHMKGKLLLGSFAAAATMLYMSGYGGLFDPYQPVTKEDLTAYTQNKQIESSYTDYFKPAELPSNGIMPK